jgi:hypothetical protein
MSEPEPGFLRRSIQSAIDAAHGRHTLFSAAFFVSGTAMHWAHRLDATYISFMGVLMGFVLGHSVKEDYFQQQGGGPK